MQTKNRTFENIALGLIATGTTLIVSGALMTCHHNPAGKELMVAGIHLSTMCLRQTKPSDKDDRDKK